MWAKLVTLFGLCKETVVSWDEDKAPRMGAALSYYTLFSLAPLLVVVIALAGFFFGHDAARGRIVGELTGIIGYEGAYLVQEMVKKASEPRSGLIASAVGLGALLIGATGVLKELHEDLNDIFRVKPRKGRGWRGTVRDRLISFAMVLAFGFMLMVSLVLSAGLAAVGDRLDHLIPGWIIVGYLLNYGVSLLLVAVLTAAIYLVLPDVRLAWRNVWVGALVTSALFHLGKLLIGLYMGKASIGSPFGAAGSLAVLLVWVYYTSQVFLLGAEFTRIYTRRYGLPPRPKAGATLLE